MLCQPMSTPLHITSPHEEQRQSYSSGVEDFMFMTFYCTRYTTERTITTYVTVPRRNSPFTLTLQKTGSLYSPPTLPNKLCVFPRQVLYIYIFAILTINIDSFPECINGLTFLLENIYSLRIMIWIFILHFFTFYILLTVHHVMILGE